MNVAVAGVAVEGVDRCVVVGRQVAHALRSRFLAGPMWSVHADERRPDGLTDACRRNDVRQTKRPYKHVDPEAKELLEEHANRLLGAVGAVVRTSPVNVEDACAFAWLQLLRCRPERQLAFAWVCTTAIPGPCASGGPRLASVVRSAAAV